MSKAKKSKLDQFAARLDEWFGVEKKTIAEVQAQLKLDGCVVSSGRLSQWWSARQSQVMQEKLLAQISTGANQVREVEKLLGKNPAPETETLIKLVRVLIMKFSTEANVTPEMSELVFNMLKPVIKWHEVQIKQEAMKLENQKFVKDTDAFFEMILAKAKELLGDNSLTQADRIAAMREAAFKDVATLQASGTLVIPK